MENLVRANLEANRHTRESRDTPKVLELDVDCTDAYGRYEIDADGRGSSTALDETPKSENIAIDGKDTNSENGVSSSANNNNPKTISTKLPLKRVTVFVETAPPVQSQQTVVLSAAVSSTKRIFKDCNVALLISKRLDVARGIPSELSCQTVLMNLFPSLIDDDGNVKNECNQSESRGIIANALDVSIAYLRRVHLFTFYNGCTFSNSVGSVLANNHPAGIIHVRLKSADEILKKAREENADIYDDLPIGDCENDEKEMNENESKMKEDGNIEMDDKTNGERTTLSTETKDMLVMRLDDSIEKISQIITKSAQRPDSYIVNESVDTLASEMQSLEDCAKQEWIDNHAVIDSDGRARCSFHFCNKLFKDKNFLQKHLLKKHPEFLDAEKAKVHDSYMMDWWDKEICRPVPHVTIDCGPKFGLKVSPVIGAAHPTVDDPEPDLWREEQERIQKIEEEEERYKEKIAASESSEQQHRKNSNSFAGDGINSMTVHASSNNFVDVDDMKDEKVELSFSNVNVTTLATNSSVKKKKKKRKKLL